MPVSCTASATNDFREQFRTKTNKNEPGKVFWAYCDAKPDVAPHYGNRVVSAKLLSTLCKAGCAPHKAFWSTVWRQFRPLYKTCPPRRLNLCWSLFSFHRLENAWKCHSKKKPTPKSSVNSFLSRKGGGLGGRGWDSCKIKLLIFQQRTKQSGNICRQRSL